MEIKTLILTKIAAYAVWASDSERGPSRIIGYYKNRARAVVGAKGKGFWCDGKVEQVELYTDGKTLYDIHDVGPFVDEKEDFEAWMKEQIKGKLTKEEQDFLNL